ncbi:MAG: hypothetical protein ABFC80_04635 [Coriobacteriales bacterium]|nr:hypothetical protein [Actinomycetes bacterium]
MGFVDWLLTGPLALRGKPLPVGEHLSSEPAFSRRRVPDDAATFKLATYGEDEAPRGSFIAVADSSARFCVDGVEVQMDEALETFSEQWGYIRVIAVEPGKVAMMTYDTRGEQHAREVLPADATSGKL